MPDDKKVFIGSTVQDLDEYRQVAEEAARLAGMLPIALESDADMGEEIVTTALQLVDSADLYLGIFAYRCGFVPPHSDVPLGEMEYDRAIARGIPTLIFLMDEDVPVSLRKVERGEGAIKLEALKHRLRREQSVQFFKSPTKLGEQILNSLVPYSVTPRVCFLAIPQAEEFNAVRDVISRALSAEGIRSTSKRDFDLDFRYGITEAVARADLVVADITDSYPNVLFEAGIAVGMRKPLLILGHDRSRVPVDIRDRQIILYDPSEIESLSPFLKRWVKEFGAPPASLTSQRT
jgi:nucleoside 2-deoxyribosyltransferase